MYSLKYKLKKNKMTYSIFIKTAKKANSKQNRVIGAYGRVYSPYGWSGSSKVMTDYKRLMPTQLTQTQINVTVGLLLGDASMERYYTPSKKGTVSPVIRFGQEPQRQELVLYYHSLMASFISAPPTLKLHKTRKKKDGSISETVVVSTLSSPVFSPFADLFYITYPEKKGKNWGRKIVSPGRASYLNAEVLAFWFAADGCLVTDKYGATAGYRLFTGDFTRDELALLQEMFYNKFGFIPTTQRSYEQLRLFVKKEHTELFRTIVEPYLPQCCHYKLYK